jgi:hypothetical protein
MINTRQLVLAHMEHLHIEGLRNAPISFQRCMMAAFSELIEEIIEVFMDDFSVYGKMFADCLANLDKVLTRCAEVDLVLNWEKCHFMVKQGINSTSSKRCGIRLSCEVLSGITGIKEHFSKCSYHSTSGLESTFRDHV